MRRLLALGIVACLAVIVVSYARRPQPPRPAPRPVLSGPAAVVERFECHRCHDAAGKLLPADRPKHCVKCHQDILAGQLDAEYPADKIARWKHHITQLTLVPTLTGIERLRRDWLVGFLQRPHDLRPELPASMPRLAIGEADARAIADHFIAKEEPGPAVTLGDSTRGREVFVRQNCGTCHHFTGVPGLPLHKRLPTPEVRLAPDLRFARERMTPGTLLSWLTTPTALKPDTLMPAFTLTDEERRDLAAFVLEAPLEAPPAPAPPRRLPVLERRVAYAEVETRVFKRVCWHCHSDPIPVGGDGGPGNTGGLGFEGRGIDFSSHAAVRRGGRDARGAPLDILAPDASGVPFVVSVLLTRHIEVSGGEVPGRRGMPLGLTPMSLEEIQLVESWISQGARPD